MFLNLLVLVQLAIHKFKIMVLVLVSILQSAIFIDYILMITN